ncbi:hypothetical protein [Glycomyces sp. NRRL B-16210]|uniref:hypothetical protein n=1 Tax=Glycomyces sp. NRRL B-16210 TaxID=1463821 RepID=UPI000AE074E3|nr:hypothetical protein [Glycomyces sp. NRRL B-16210]
MHLPTGRRVTLVGAIGAALLLAAAPALAQDDEPGYAAWTLEGGSRAYTGTMTLPGNFPAAEFTSDARSDSLLRTGMNTWLGENTPFGEVYGSSRNQPYPSLRPNTNTPPIPSTTTYTFAAPTPASGWGFALGDIDADTVTVSATGADGEPVPVGALGFQDTFNFCETTPRPNTCTGVTDFHQPTWDPATGTLAGDGADRTGGVGWFQPTVPLTTLTFTFTPLSGAPTYQTWFAKLALPDPEEPTDEPGTEAPTTPPTAAPTGEPGAEPSATEPGGSAKPAADGGRPTLPSTGAPLLATAAAGLAALGAGALLLAARRARTETN